MWRILIGLILVGSGVARAGTVTGRVIENGFRVAEFGVFVFDLREPPTPVNDGDGRFVLRDVPPGRHELVFVGWAFATTRRWIDVREDGATDVGSIPVDQGRRITGVVTDAAGDPIDGATVMVFAARPVVITSPLELMAAGVRVATTDAAGAYVIDGVSDERDLRIAAGAGELRSIEHIVPPQGNGRINLVASRPGTIAGTIANPSKLTTRAIYARPVGVAARPAVAGIDPHGEFRFDLPAGIYDLALADEKLGPLQVVVVADRVTRAKLAAPAAHFDLEVDAPDCIVATLFATRPNDPIPRTEIEIEVCEGGRARFAGLAPGDYRVCVDGGDACDRVTLRARRQVLHAHRP